MQALGIILCFLSLGAESYLGHMLMVTIHDDGDDDDGDDHDDD